jgi:hypothetical protein
MLLCHCTFKLIWGGGTRKFSRSKVKMPVSKTINTHTHIYMGILFVCDDSYVLMIEQQCHNM